MESRIYKTDPRYATYYVGPLLKQKEVSLVNGSEKIVFLGVDGVLNSEEYSERRRLRVLKKLLTHTLSH